VGGPFKIEVSEEYDLVFVSLVERGWGAPETHTSILAGEDGAELLTFKSWGDFAFNPVTGYFYGTERAYYGDRGYLVYDVSTMELVETIPIEPPRADYESLIVVDEKRSRVLIAPCPDYGDMCELDGRNHDIVNVVEFGDDFILTNRDPEPAYSRNHKKRRLYVGLTSDGHSRRLGIISLRGPRARPVAAIQFDQEDQCQPGLTSMANSTNGTVFVPCNSGVKVVIDPGAWLSTRPRPTEIEEASSPEASKSTIGHFQ